MTPETTLLNGSSSSKHQRPHSYHPHFVERSYQLDPRGQTSTNVSYKDADNISAVVSADPARVGENNQSRRRPFPDNRISSESETDHNYAELEVEASTEADNNVNFGLGVNENNLTATNVKPNENTSRARIDTASIVTSNNQVSNSLDGVRNNVQINGDLPMPHNSDVRQPTIQRSHSDDQQLEDQRLPSKLLRSFSDDRQAHNSENTSSDDDDDDIVVSSAITEDYEGIDGDNEESDDNAETDVERSIPNEREKEVGEENESEQGIVEDYESEPGEEEEEEEQNEEEEEEEEEGYVEVTHEFTNDEFESTCNVSAGSSDIDERSSVSLDILPDNMFRVNSCQQLIQDEQDFSENDMHASNDLPSALDIETSEKIVDHRPYTNSPQNHFLNLLSFNELYLINCSFSNKANSENVTSQAVGVNDKSMQAINTVTENNILYITKTSPETILSNQTQEPFLSLSESSLIASRPVLPSDFSEIISGRSIAPTNVKNEILNDNQNAGAESRSLEESKGIVTMATPVSYINEVSLIECENETRIHENDQFNKYTADVCEQSTTNRCEIIQQHLVEDESTEQENIAEDLSLIERNDACCKQTETSIRSSVQSSSPDKIVLFPPAVVNRSNELPTGETISESVNKPIYELRIDKPINKGVDKLVSKLDTKHITYRGGARPRDNNITRKKATRPPVITDLQNMRENKGFKRNSWAGLTELTDLKERRETYKTTDSLSLLSTNLKPPTRKYS